MDEQLERILTAARQQVGEPDAIVDLYSMNFVYVTPSAAERFGYAPEEMYGRQIYSFSSLSEENRKDILKGVLTKGGVIDDMKLLRKDGDEASVSVAFTLIRVDGHPYQVARITS